MPYEKQNIFNCVKTQITARAAADMYGLKVKPSGMCRCPFHDDHEPSMKVGTRFHCFGCGADGDVIGLAARLFGLEPYEAALKLADDFGITTKPKRNKKARGRPDVKKGKELTFDEKLQRLLALFLRKLLEYHSALLCWKEAYAPRNGEEIWDPLFEEALSELTKLEYIIDCFLEGSYEEQVGILIEYGRKVLSFDEHKDRTD